MGETRCTNPNKNDGLTVVFFISPNPSTILKALVTWGLLHRSEVTLTFAFPLERQEADAVGELQIAEVPSFENQPMGTHNNLQFLGFFFTHIWGGWKNLHFSMGYFSMGTHISFIFRGCFTHSLVDPPTIVIKWGKTTNPLKHPLKRWPKINGVSLGWVITLLKKGPHT